MQTFLIVFCVFQADKLTLMSLETCCKVMCCPLCVQEETGISMLQQEKNIRTQVDALLKERTQRMQQLKLLLEQDQDLSDILCSMPYGINHDSVPTPEQLESFSQHIANQNAEKGGAPFVLSVSVQWF